ncbi:hypothetical protein V2J09_023917 [Rumex salicifolius]
MDRYHRVEKPKAETPIDENEIRITSQGRMRSYISYAMTLLQEKGSNEIVFKAMGRAINKTVTIVELIKRRIVGLHQVTTIGSTDITDTWEPLEEGLLPLETTRHVSMITIILSKEELETSAIGLFSHLKVLLLANTSTTRIGAKYEAFLSELTFYQLLPSLYRLNAPPPLPADQVKPSFEYDYDGEGSPSARGRGRGRGRGGRGGRGRGRGPPGNGYMAAEFDDGGWDQNRGYARGRGRGRGRGFRGRGRGGYNYDGPMINDQQNAGGYNGGAPPRGRGRGRGGRGRGWGRGPRPNPNMQVEVAAGVFEFFLVSSKPYPTAHRSSHGHCSSAYLDPSSSSSMRLLKGITLSIPGSQLTLKYYELQTLKGQPQTHHKKPLIQCSQRGDHRMEEEEKKKMKKNVAWISILKDRIQEQRENTFNLVEVS